MIRKHKTEILFSFLFTLLPIVIGLVLWNRLPEQIATHFDMNGNPNGWSSRPVAVFGIPVFLTIMQGICIFTASSDPKKKNLGETGFRIILWIIPFCSWICCVSCYMMAIGKQVNVGTIVCMFLGILLIIIGNYLPKNKQNYTFGVRCAWTLNDPENWNYTNRIAGCCFIAAGILTMICTFLSHPKFILPIILLASLIPYVCSYLYYRSKGDGTSGKDSIL